MIFIIIETIKDLIFETDIEEKIVLTIVIFLLALVLAGLSAMLFH